MRVNLEELYKFDLKFTEHSVSREKFGKTLEAFFTLYDNRPSAIVSELEKVMRIEIKKRTLRMLDETQLSEEEKKFFFFYNFDNDKEEPKEE